MYVTLDLRFDQPNADDLHKLVLIWVLYPYLKKGESICINGSIGQNGVFLDNTGQKVEEYVVCWGYVPNVKMEVKI